MHYLCISNKQLNICKAMRRNIIASFFLDVHSSQFNHFVSLFGSRYEYHYSHFAGRPVVDVVEC